MLQLFIFATIILLVGTLLVHISEYFFVYSPLEAIGEILIIIGLLLEIVLLLWIIWSIIMYFIPLN